MKIIIIIKLIITLAVGIIKIVILIVMDSCILLKNKDTDNDDESSAQNKEINKKDNEK